MGYEYKVHFGAVEPLCRHAVWSDNMIVTVVHEDVTCWRCIRMLGDDWPTKTAKDTS